MARGLPLWRSSGLSFGAPGGGTNDGLQPLPPPQRVLKRSPWNSASSSPRAAGCRAYVVVQNDDDTAYQTVKLDLVLFQQDGVIGRRFAIDLAPLKATKRTVKLLRSRRHSPATRIGSLLINDVVDCKTAAGPARRICLAGITVKSLTHVQLTKAAIDEAVKGIPVEQIVTAAAGHDFSIYGIDHAGRSDRQVGRWLLLGARVRRVLGHHPREDRPPLQARPQSPNARTHGARRSPPARKCRAVSCARCSMRRITRPRTAPAAARTRSDLRARLERAMRSALTLEAAAASRSDCRSSPPSDPRRRSSACSARCGAS